MWRNELKIVEELEMKKNECGNEELKKKVKEKKEDII